MARELVVRIVGDSDSFERALKKSERSARTFSQRMTRHLGAIGVAGGAALGAGIAVGLKQSIDAAMEAEKVLGQTQVALQNVGQSWKRYGAKIQDTTTSLSRLAAVNDEDLLQSFTVLLRGTKDVNRALELNAAAADFARGRNMDLVSAATLLVKVNAGQLGPARRLGIQLDKNATSQEALTEITRRYAGAAEAYGQSAAGAQDRFRVAVDELEEAIGEGLLPTITEYTKQLTKWLENPDNKEQVVDGFATAVRGLGSAFQFAADTIGFFKSAWDKLPDFGKHQGLIDILDMRGETLTLGEMGGGGNFGTGGARPGYTGPSRSGAGRAGQFLAPDAFSGPILRLLEQAKKWEAAHNKWLEIRKRAEAAEARYQTRKETRLGWLDFALERADVTKTKRDNLRVLRAREAAVKGFIQHEGRTLELVSELWRTRQKIRDLNKKQARDGDPLAGLMQVSSKRMANMLAAGTGLNLAGRRVLGANIAGLEMRPVYVAVHIDGREVGRAVTKDQARTAHRTSRQTSGYRG